VGIWWPLPTALKLQCKDFYSWTEEFINYVQHAERELTCGKNYFPCLLKPQMAEICYCKQLYLGSTSYIPSRNILLITWRTQESRESVFRIATGYGLDDQGVGVRFAVRGKNFYFSMSSRPVLRSTQPPIQWVPGTLSPEVKRQGHEADHSPPASTDVKKIYTSTPPYAFMA
jgi:hypothetical protein